MIKNAEVLDSHINNDNLLTSAKFSYKLLTTDLEVVAFGDLLMEGQDYADFQTNQYAWDWIASKLNLIIIEDF